MLALALGGVLVVAAPASAATITVTDPGDTNTPGTLRYALSNLTPGALNTITFLIPGHTITAATALPTITESVIITGPGQSALTINSTWGTVFTIAGGSPNIDVTISDLTITSPVTGACGIGADHANLTLTNVSASHFDCSGVAVNDGSLTATDVTVEHDATGIAFVGTNSAHFLTLSRVHAAGAAFSGVNAVVEGAVATVSNIDADDSAALGFYLAATNSATAMISGVRANRSGAVGVTVLTDVGATATLSDSSSDSGLGQGLDLQATDHSSLAASRLTATNNASSGLWLSVTNLATLTVDTSLSTGTLANSGIWVDQIDNAILTLSRTRVLGNTSNFGGGIFFREVTGAATVNLSALTVAGNTSTDDGGGIDVDHLADDGTSLTISDSTISNNSSVDFGGGLYLRGIGGGVTSTAHVIVQRTTFDGNHAGGYGGAIAINDPAGETSGLPTVLVDSSTLSNNTTPYGGGGIDIRRTSSGAPAVVKILNSTVSSNDAQEGGGVDVSASQSGGGPDGPGGPGGPGAPGPLLLTTVISHSTIVDNSAHTSASVSVNHGDQALQIDDSILARGTSNNGNTPNDLDVGSSYTVLFSLVQRPSTNLVVSPAGGNIIGLDPQLGPLANNGGPTMTRLIAPGSPAYNAGDPAFSGVGLFDQRGLARVFQVVDMGAVEWQPALAYTGQRPTPEPPLIAFLLLFAGLAMVAFSRLQTARSVN